MVPSIARQSVIIKCSMKKSYLLGNYEFYYAAGLFKKLFGAELQADMPPQEMLQRILKQADISPKDDREEYLVFLLKKYEPDEELDEEMQMLFAWGEKDEEIWVI